MCAELCVGCRFEACICGLGRLIEGEDQNFEIVRHI